jgi:hypothetical protein
MHTRKYGRMAALGLVAAGVLAVGGAQAQDYTVPTGPVTIKIKLKGKRPFFKGPKRISQGEKLTVLNTTSPKKIGPHTFTLIKPSLVPNNKAERKACGHGAGVCGRVAAAHKFNPQTEQINKPDVDVGGKGWNKSFGKKGDTWFTQAKGASETRRVSAPVGTVLTYFCAVHPRMQGKIRVVD